VPPEVITLYQFFETVSKVFYSYVVVYSSRTPGQAVGTEDQVPGHPGSDQSSAFTGEHALLPGGRWTFHEGGFEPR